MILEMIAAALGIATVFMVGFLMVCIEREVQKDKRHEAR